MLRRVVVAAAASAVQGFYLPGVAPIEYPEGGEVELKVNALTSVKTQLPYGYYELPYCLPDEIEEMVENLGEILTGDQIQNSPYDIRMLLNETCKVLCKRKLTQENKKKIQDMIDDEYMVNWIIDNLPAATRYSGHTIEILAFQHWGDSSGRHKLHHVVNGFPVGINVGGAYYLNNHVRIHLQYHESPNEYEGYRIVGFEVEPWSQTQYSRNEGGFMTAICHDFDSSEAMLFDIQSHDEVTYTYDVIWTESQVRWASRWDNYLKMSKGEIHWFSILNSLMIMLFLSGMVAMILIRTLHHDILKYNEIAAIDDSSPEETGWKLLHGDIFRKPRHSKFLVVSIGSGVQLLCMAIVTLVFALMGLLSPAHRGGLLQCSMLLFTFMGIFAGYVCSRLYKMWGGQDWKVTTLLMAFLYPGLFFGIFFVLNLLIWGQESSGAVPFPTMLSMVALWFGISVPLVFLGAYFGFQKPTIELPVRTNQIPRQVPRQPWFLHWAFMALVGGILPFGAVFTELFFIMSSLWQHLFYYLFGFLSLVLVILLVICAEISIAFTYLQLMAEDHNWWWRAFLNSGTSALYVFLYSAHYFTAKLSISHLVGTLLYFGYMSIISIVFFLLSGTVGALASFFFVRSIYSSIKID